MAICADQVTVDGQGTWAPLSSNPMASTNWRKGFWSLTAPLITPPSSSHTEQFRKRILSETFRLSNLDRVNVLGDEEGYGHKG
jgi:hypothetical protein